MEIEDNARSLIVRAVEVEQNLQELEDLHGEVAAETMKQYMMERRRLIMFIGRLNAVANFSRKGRDDFAAEVIEVALQVCRQRHRMCGSHGHGKQEEEMNVAGRLAADVVESFFAMRSYLSEVSGCISRVDPHLRNNPGLCARLVDFEETWEIGSRYVLDLAVRQEVCGLVTEVRHAAMRTQSLAAMCENCDAELFLYLPRIVWLRFLSQPEQSIGLVRALLPHRFSSTQNDQELDHLVAKYKAAMQHITNALLKDGGQLSAPEFCETRRARLLLMRRAASDATEMSETYESLLVPGTRRDSAAAAVEALMHDLEAWSMELQRHCPDDWNQCAAVLVQQLSEGQSSPKDRRAQFKV
jgi:hypothetical protein